jgi:DNA-binding NarL/FixJ family response regulator
MVTATGCGRDTTDQPSAEGAQGGLCSDDVTPERVDRLEELRVLIADDHPVFRDGLRTLLTSIPGTEVVGEATTGLEAVQEALTIQPDVVIMDLDLPELDGVSATRRIVANSPHIGVLVLTMFDDDSVFAAMRAGARGYLLKGADQQEIRRAIVAVSEGEAIFGPAVAQRLVDYFSAARPDVPTDVFPGLTDRERQVLHLLAQGFANAVIATRLGISAKTVRNHVSNIFTKLQVTDRAQAIVRAREAGLGMTEERHG